MTPRAQHRRNIEGLLQDSPVVALIGARQVGKTTLAKELAAQHPCRDRPDRGTRRAAARLRGEAKSAPAVTRSMRTAVADLELDSLDVIHAGEHTSPLAERIRAVAAARMLADLP